MTLVNLSTVPDCLSATRMTGLLKGDLIKWEMDFEQVAKADSASASASLYLSYNPMWDTAAITGSHTPSIGTWTTVGQWRTRRRG